MGDALSSFFAELERRADAAGIAGMNGTFQFIATGEDGGEYYVKVVDGRPEVGAGIAPNPNVSLTASVGDWQDIASGKLNGQAAFLTGKLKLQGDITLAMKLQHLLSP